MTTSINILLAHIYYKTDGDIQNIYQYIFFGVMISFQKVFYQRPFTESLTDVIYLNGHTKYFLFDIINLFEFLETFNIFKIL